MNAKIFIVTAIATGIVAAPAIANDSNQGAVTGAAGGAVTGAIVGGPVGAAIVERSGSSPERLSPLRRSRS